MKHIAVLILAVLASACSEKFRQFDGTIGFKSNRADDGTLIASYTGNATVSSEQIVKSISEGCATELSADPQQVAVSEKREEIKESTIWFTIPVAAIVNGHTPSLSPSGTSEAVLDSQIFNEKVSVQLKTKTLHGKCSLVSAAP